MEFERMTLKQMTINRKRLQDKIEALNKIGKLGETGVRRLALSKEYREGIDLVKTWMDEIGLKTRVDHFGNLFGRLEGKDPNAPVVMIGSHIDSQPNGGRFDGTIGVLGALETVQTMIESNHTPEVPIEIVAFCDEEGFRFNTGVFGSRGITGKWTEDDLKRSDQDGMSRRDALIEFGADPNRLKESEYAKGSIASFIEMHIEQGPVLEAKNLPVGIVTGIAGPLWLTVELTGFAGHAGGAHEDAGDREEPGHRGQLGRGGLAAERGDERHRHERYHRPDREHETQPRAQPVGRRERQAHRVAAAEEDRHPAAPRVLDAQVDDRGGADAGHERPGTGEHEPAHGEAVGRDALGEAEADSGDDPEGDRDDALDRRLHDNRDAQGLGWVAHAVVVPEPVDERARCPPRDPEHEGEGRDHEQ